MLFRSLNIYLNKILETDKLDYVIASDTDSVYITFDKLVDKLFPKGGSTEKIMQLLFGRTPLLKDVKRGLKGSGSAESVNRLAVIMLLTLSIVTLAAVQGYTGTLVDEKTADATVGSDLQISTEEANAGPKTTGITVSDLK